MSTYTVNFTDVNASPITVYEQSVDKTSTDLSLFGYIRLRYGDELQENLLHLLENFSCHEDVSNPGNPDLTQSLGNILENPTVGQFWYNKSTGLLNVYTGMGWMPVPSHDDIAANWGTIFHGEQIPKPVSPTSGRVFEYNECVWSVAPAAYDTSFSVMNCATDGDGVLEMTYGTPPTVIPGMANYLIIGLNGNKNLGALIPPPLPSGVTPTPTPTYGLTPTVTPTITSTNAITPTVTPTNTQTPVVTSTVTPTPSPLPLGVDTRLYTSPSPGDPGGVGPGGTGIRLYSTCGPNISYTQVEQAYHVSLQDLSGGVGPYTANFNSIVVSPISGWYSRTGESAQYALPPMHMDITYHGGIGSDNNWLRSGLDGTMIPYVKIVPRFDDPTIFDSTYTYYIAYTITGRIILADSLGQSVSWYVPREPTEVGGSDNRTATDWELPLNYGHYELCSDCPNCL